MHYVFRSRADADLIMMGPGGRPAAAHHRPRAGAARDHRGGGAAGGDPAIEAAVAADRREHGRATTRPRKTLKEPRVGLAQRAWPLLEMMKRALAEKADIVWGV